MNWKNWMLIVVGVAAAAVALGLTMKKKPPPGGVSKVREPAVAGLFYPQSKDTLAAMIDGFLSRAEVPPVDNLRGLVCPHAGYPFSGQTAAYAYRQLIGRDIRTVVVMGPSHYALFRGVSIPDVAAYRTPLGTVNLSPKAKELAKVPPFVSNPSCRVRRPSWWRQSPKKAPPSGEDTPHTWEHSLEVQLPFLQKTLNDFTIIPIVFAPEEIVDEEKAARVLLKYVDDKTLLVASSDLSHYHPYDAARKMDQACTKVICELDIGAMDRQEACGKGPILTLMHIAKTKGWKAKLLDYRNSGDTSGDKSAVVGYAAIAFFAPEEAAVETIERAPLTSEEREFLLDLARRTIEQVVTSGTMPEADATGLSSNLMESKGCFVTLKKSGELRGCIGHIFPREPLYKAVMDNARNAATRDLRFSPVRPEELEEIEIEISVLTVPQTLHFDSPDDLLAKLRPGVDGVVLKIGGRQATFLPQVWEQLPEKETFLAHLSEKAGLPSRAWRGPGTAVLIYQVEAFKESDR